MRKMTNFTEGTWRVEERRPGDFGIYAGNRCIGFVIANALPDIPTEEHGYNAQLMSASPLLLKVARSVIFLYNHGNSATQWALRGLVDDAKFAIGAATGEEPD